MAVIKKAPTFEVCFYIGSKENYDGRIFDEHYVKRLIKIFQNDDNHPVRISPCSYLRTADYEEAGWEISAISYPNSKYNPEEIKKFATNLASYLLAHLKQNRITIRAIGFGEWAHLSETLMLEADNAVQLQDVLKRDKYASRNK